MIKVEFHCHTCYSKDSLVQIRDLLTTAPKRGLDRVVITDHNSLGAAEDVLMIDPYMFIMGEEIMTREGELIGIYMKELVPSGLSAIQTIEILRQQDAFITIAHPFDHFRKGGWNIDDLVRISPLIDAIEVFNARCMLPSFNRKARRYAASTGLLATVGSDSHSLAELGTATLLLPEFVDPFSLKKALAHAQPKNRLSPPWVHFYSRYASWKKKQSNNK